MPAPTFLVAPVRAASLADLVGYTTVTDIRNPIGTTTSTTYTATLTGAGALACGIAFTAPSSGKVLIFNNCAVSNSGANFSICTIRVRTGAVIGSGSDVLGIPADQDEEALVNNGTTDDRKGCSRLLSGLTAGASYNVQQLFRVTAGTGSFFRKSLIVQKVL